jgi:hypothetical protein
LAEVAENCPNSAMGGVWVGERGGGVSPQLILIKWPQAVRQMRGVGGGKGERRGGMGQITAHSNPHSSFSLSFFPLCVRRGFDEKIQLLAVQHNHIQKLGGEGARQITPAAKSLYRPISLDDDISRCCLYS